jgi:acyl-CoA synthetase (AMP-forming)/AMP-acid ligase II
MVFRSPYPDVIIPERSFSDYVFEHVARWGDAPAFIDGPSGRTLTFAEVADGARRVASSMAERGLHKGDVFALYCPNLPEYAVAVHGVVMLGGVVTTANPLYTADELAYQLNDAGATYVLTVPPSLDKAKKAAAKTGVRELFVIGEAPGATPFSELLQGNGHPPEVHINPREDVALLPYSSGTVGRPKGVVLTHYNLTALLQQIAPLLPDRLGDRVLGFLPFFHIFGLQVLRNNTLRNGITCVTMPRFDFELFLRFIQEHRITRLYAVPPIVLGLAKQPLVDQYDLSSLRCILSGAAPLDGAIQQTVASRLNVPVVQGYGMTETSLAIALTPPDSASVKVGAAGVLIPNMEGKVVDPLTGTELGAHERGELLVRGPNIMRGYLKNRDATTVTIEPDGWLHTGDIVSVDEEGYIFVVDRLKELIKYKGMQVAPAEVEGVLVTHPAIADAAVIGIPDEEAGEVPKAFVALKEATTPEAIMQYVAGKVAPHKRVRQVEIVDAIPKSASGKILRRVLVEREQAQRAGQTAPPQGAQSPTLTRYPDALGRKPRNA